MDHRTPAAHKLRARPIGNATLQGWQVGTQNRVNNAKKESGPIALDLLAKGANVRSFSPLVHNSPTWNILRRPILLTVVLISFQFGNCSAQLTILYKLKTLRQGQCDSDKDFISAHDRVRARVKPGGRKTTKRIVKSSTQDGLKCRSIGSFKQEK